MSLLLESCLKTLDNTKDFLLQLTDAELTNKTVAPYYSSVGSHVRHILDFYNCIVNEVENGVDLSKRERNLEVELYSEVALEYLEHIKNSLQQLDYDENRILQVSDDFGNGIICLNYTFGALLAQANSHTIHHHAIINYILDRLGIVITNSRFGFNPTTPAF